VSTLYFLLEQALVNDLVTHFELLLAGGTQSPEVEENLLERLTKCQYIRAGEPKPNDPEQPF
jgi:hypothetical protein